MAILHIFSEEPHPELVALALAKAKSYHFSRKPVFVYGKVWPHLSGGSFDELKYHIRDDETEIPSGHMALEGCQALLEGLEAGYRLAKKHYSKPADIAGKKRR